MQELCTTISYSVYQEVDGGYDREFESSKPQLVQKNELDYSLYIVRDCCSTIVKGELRGLRMIEPTAFDPGTSACGYKAREKNVLIICKNVV